MAINYGSDKLRFLQPVAVGSRIRAVVEVIAVEQVRQGLRTTSRVTVEIEGADRPALVAETLALYVTAAR